MMITLIREYTQLTTKLAMRLRQELGAEDLLRGWHQHLFPQRGTLSDGTKFQFHGIGCCVEQGEIDVDFDFGHGGRADGFDAWRLWRYAKQYPKEFAEFQQLEVVERTLEGLIENGSVRRSESEDDHLFYLAEPLRNGEQS